MKAPRPPGSGKAIARTKGVHREMESGGRSRQISGLTNRNHIRLVMGIRPPNRMKSYSYTEETVEEGKDAIPDDTAIQRAGMEGT